MVATTIGIVGAGSIGCFVGGALMLGGAPVRFFGRPRIAAELQEYGLQISDFRGLYHEVAPDSLSFHTDVAQMQDVGCWLITVKSAASESVAAEIAPFVEKDALVISLQNGVGNGARIQAQLPQATVLEGMVAFNVLHRGHGSFHAGTDGAIVVQQHPALAKLAAALGSAGVPFERHRDMRSVQWSKLLLNLNNPLNALSGLPLKEELSQRAYRQCLALLQREAIRAIKAAGIPLQKLTAAPTSMLPLLLSSPDYLFRRLAQSMLAIDPLARSSMWEDLERGRLTEVDWINGEVVRLARSQNLPAPANERMLSLIKAAERGGRRDYGGDELLSLLTAAVAEGGR